LENTFGLYGGSGVGSIIKETGQRECGTFGILRPRTEQYALGPSFYFINYDYEVYGHHFLAEDPYEHGPKVMDILLNKEVPKLGGNPLFGDGIDKCWQNKYVIVSELASHVKMLLDERIDGAGSSGEGSEEEGNNEEVSNEMRTPIEPSSTARWRMVICVVLHGLLYGLGIMDVCLTQH
jgi:hypothetical protein